MADDSLNLEQGARETRKADDRIKPFIRRTPLEYSRYLSRVGQCDVYLKCENLQVTGSFKLRGAANYLLSLTDAEKEKGAVTASTGNHAAAFAYMADRLGVPGVIYLPENASPAKLEALAEYRLELRQHGTDCVEAEQAARETAERNSQLYVSPYNDPLIIRGQGTVGVELDNELEEIDAVLVPVGGGGLAAGVAGYLKSSSKTIQIIGCQPENSAVMCESVRQGHIVNVMSRPTLSDGTAGGIEPGSITFEYCRELIDQFVLVSEDEIKAALRLIIERHQMLIEGAAALPVAAFIKCADQFSGKRVVLILTGRKISPEVLKAVLAD